MKRRIFTFGRYFAEFMEGLTAKEREKVDYGLVLLKTQDRLPSKFVKHIRNGLYELRTEYDGNIYRVYANSYEDKMDFYHYKTIHSIVTALKKGFFCRIYFFRRITILIQTFFENVIFLIGKIKMLFISFCSK